MEKNFEKKYHQLEAEHWWFKGRRDYILEMTDKLDRSARILDIGCSSGLLLKDLLDQGFAPKNLHGIDISEEAIHRAKNAGFEHVHVMDATNIELEAGSYDLLIASDCLEHLEEDEIALKNWYKLLKPEGILIVFVPAFQSLWSKHDEVNLHYRRYTNSLLRQRMSGAHFTLLKHGYWNFFLFPPVYAVRQLQRVIKSADREEHGDLKMPGKLTNRLLTNLLFFENRLLKFIRSPFGVSTFCIAKKGN